jgi:hypothetical protein
VRILPLIACINLPAIHSESNQSDYYKNEFAEQQVKYPHDTLFSKVVWHKKVSHLVLGEKAGKNRVILLMRNPHPDAYKSQNYPIYYEFENYQQAMDKFMWINKFLKNDGVLTVKLNGALITEEKIIYTGKERN